ncbi:MAG: UDP-N-acetylmuramate--L-alanine ligase [Ignavibacteriae bacterium]|nr:UDP-N-acetylmuramate--L-alanine ligase [Ignavibacteriota bacterium]
MENKDINMLDGVKKAHLIGIGGIGMSGIADYLLESGIIVTGSDIGTGYITDRLKKSGATIYPLQAPENVTSDIDIVIYSSAIKQNNPEIREASTKNIKKVRRAEMLGSIVNSKFLIAVSGTHGKTTTTSIIAKILIDAGADPTVFVGGNLDFLEGGSSRIGNGNIAVVEADEYDRSFFALKADVIVINNLELDHTDIFKNLDEVKAAFTKFCSYGKKDLKIIANADDDNTMSLLTDKKTVVPGKNFLKTQSKKSSAEEITYEVKTFGKSPDADFQIEEIQFSGKQTLYRINNHTKDVSVKNAIDNISLIITGEHNVYNATASFAACITAGIETENIKTSLSEFTGLKRRLELKFGELFGEEVSVFDDYAHHPTEIMKSFEAVKNHAVKNSSGRVITVFQPHTYTRTLQFFKEFADSLKGNDVVFLTRVYPAREPEIDGVSSYLILKELKGKAYTSTSPAYYFESNSDLLRKLSEVIIKGDTIIFQGAGDITLLCEKFINDYLRIK